MDLVEALLREAIEKLTNGNIKESLYHANCAVRGLRKKLDEAKPLKDPDDPAGHKN